MAKLSNRRQKRLRKTKAELVAELEALERRLATGGGVSDAYFRAVIRNSPTAIFVRDVDSRYLMVNRAYERLRNVSDEKIFGKTPHAVFDRQSADTLVARDREVLKLGRKIERESVLTLNDGSTRVQSTILFPFHDSQVHAIGICGIVTDLAQQKRAEQAVRVSEERLHAAIDSLREGFVLFDADDRLVAFNDRYLQLRPASQRILARGGTFEDMVREHVRLGMIPEAVGREEAFVRERMEQHRNFKGPIVRRFVDGRWYLIDEARTPEGGTALSVVDITDLKRTENALRKSEALFRAVVNHSPTKIHIKDVEGRYTLINKEAEKLFGVTDEDGRGKTSYDLFPKDVADAFMAHDRAVIQSGKAMEKEEEFTLEDDVHTFLTVKFPIYDLEGMAAVGAIGTDITERKRAEETVRRLAAAIEGLSENFALYGP
ncbi:MAG: PAS domain-containing protein, partial [Rhodospirillales bacterium]